MFTKLATKMFGSKNAREIKRMRKVVARINDLEEQFGALSDTELQGKTAEFRRRLDDGESLDALLPEAFAMDLGVWVVCHENLRATPRCAAVFDGLVSGLDDYVRSGGRS